jgi:hypothetical protein
MFPEEILHLGFMMGGGMAFVQADSLIHDMSVFPLLSYKEVLHHYFVAVFL